jgi:hypothetical protein
MQFWRLSSLRCRVMRKTLYDQCIASDSRETRIVKENRGCFRRMEEEDVG